MQRRPPRVAPQSATRLPDTTPDDPIKRWSVTCGHCGHAFSPRVAVAEPMVARCGECGCLNQWKA